MSGLLRSVLELDKKIQGPSPTFTAAHLLLAILTIYERSQIGRKELSKELGLGEGATRTVLKKLAELGIVDTSASGNKLTSKGNRFYKFLREIFRGPFEIPPTSITIGKCQATILFKNCGSRVKDGIAQRDRAIIFGADGATTYVYIGSKFTVPSGSRDCEKDYPNDIWSLIRDKLQPQENDVVIVCGASTTVNAKLGCIAAGLTLI